MLSLKVVATYRLHSYYTAYRFFSNAIKAITFRTSFSYLLSFTHPCTGLKLKSICYKIHRGEERSADLGFFACVTAPLLDGRRITAMQTSCLWSGLCICISACMCLCGSFPRLPSITSDLRPPVQTGSFFFLIHFADTWNACFSTCTEY